MKLLISLSDFFSISSEGNGVLFKDDFSNVHLDFPKDEKETFFIDSDEKIVEYSKKLLVELYKYEKIHSMVTFQHKKLLKV